MTPCSIGFLRVLVSWYNNTESELDKWPLLTHFEDKLVILTKFRPKCNRLEDNLLTNWTAP